MSIPLYFIAKRKELVTLPNARPLPYSYGMSKDGSLRTPEIGWAGTPIILDDAYTGKLTPSFMERLKLACTNGCILDFERPGNSFHMALIRALEAWELSPYWIPEAFAPHSKKATVIVSSTLPHNSWKMYCKCQQQKYTNRWALELQPINCIRKLPQAQKDRTFYLEESTCNCRIRGNEITYYDTGESLLRKLHIAESFGCQGAIALWNEWPKK